MSRGPRKSQFWGGQGPPSRSPANFTKINVAPTKLNQTEWLASLTNLYNKGYLLGQKNHEFSTYLDVWKSVKVAWTTLNGAILSMSAKSEDPKHPKTTPNVPESSLSTFPDRWGNPLVPFNPSFLHGIAHRRPATKLHPHQTCMALPRPRDFCTKMDVAHTKLDQIECLASPTNL